MTREKAKLLQAELGDTVEWWMELQTPRPKTVSWHPVGFDQKGIYTYKLKAKPLKQVSWSSVPVGVMTNKGELRNVFGIKAITETPAQSKHGYSSLEYLTCTLELAPASEQDWIAVQDGGSFVIAAGLIIERHRSGEKYRITGIAKGYKMEGAV